MLRAVEETTSMEGDASHLDFEDWSEERGDDDDDDSVGGLAFFSISKVVVRTSIFAAFVFVLGCATSGGFLAFGLTSAQDDADQAFARRSNELVQIIETAFRDYETAALQTHNLCRRSFNVSRTEFREFYEYLVAGGLEFESTQCNINATHPERPELEAESQAFVDEFYPYIDYQGFHSVTEDVRSEAPFYFVVHYLEPVAGNEAALDLDTYSFGNQAAEINRAIATREPVPSARLRIIQEQDDGAYSVIIYHPGIDLETSPEDFPRELGMILVRMPSLLHRVARLQEESLGMYVYDTTFFNTQGEPAFLGAAEFRVKRGLDGGKVTETTILEELDYVNLLGREATDRTFEREVDIASGTWDIIVIPIDDTYDPKIIFVIFGGAMIFLAGVGLALWMVSNMRRVVQVYKAKKAAEAEKNIVESLFPANVIDRLKRDAERKQEAKRARARQRKFGSLEPDEREMLVRKDLLTSEELFGSKPIADFHPNVTIVCIDLAGFTAWSSVREPSQVLTLLEVVYHYFDLYARRRRIFKVEAVGDCYVAAAGVPDARRDHAVAIARYASSCLQKFHVLVQELETNLGPETGDLELRVGIHSGAVTAGVLRGDKGRFQLFGETVNTALTLEEKGKSSQIHVSSDTADLVKKAGKGHWLRPRDDKVFVRGRGHTQTFWLQRAHSTASVISKTSSHSDEGRPVLRMEEKVDKLERLVRWNVAELSGLLKQVLARRSSSEQRSKAKLPDTPAIGCELTGKLPLEEVVDVITLPKFDSNAFQRGNSSPENIELPSEVVEELTHFIRQIASMYRDNPFHNFEHASHVAMSVTKQLSRIKNPKEVLLRQGQAALEKTGEKGVTADSAAFGLHADLHDYTFGITSDPMTQLAAFVAAMIHDVDHPGVPNGTMIIETPDMAAKYKNKSIAEQNSVDLSWNLLMDGRYQSLRQCLFGNQTELLHFRQLVVNMVMATDVMDKDLNALRKERWNKAFSEAKPDEESVETHTNRKATIVIEHLIQASDVSHTMQHFHVYKKWNERLFMELYLAFVQGRLEKDPSTNWYKGELGFLEFYVLPLGRKLDTCGVFGVSSEEFRFYAMENMREWQLTGNDLVSDYLVKFERQYGGVKDETTRLEELPEYVERAKSKAQPEGLLPGQPPVREQVEIPKKLQVHPSSTDNEQFTDEAPE